MGQVIQTRPVPLEVGAEVEVGVGVAARAGASSTCSMDAIKKKMQAMKVEKDNAMDRADLCELSAKEAKVAS